MVCHADCRTRLQRLRKPALIRALAATATLLVAAFAGEAATARECPDWLDDGAMKATAAPYTCTCGSKLARHAVYGVFRYHPASHLCTAARHDGRIGLRGGTITIYFGPGCAYYREAWRNGVQSRRKGASRASFAFVRRLPPCSPKPLPRPGRKAKNPPRDPTEPDD